MDLRDSDPPLALRLEVGGVEERQTDHGDGGRDGDGTDPSEQQPQQPAEAQHHLEHGAQ